MGDFNAKNDRIYPTSSPNHAGQVLSDLLDQQPIGNGFICKRQLVNRVIAPTRRNEANGSENLIDFVITDITANHISVSHICKLSDHDTLFIDLKPTNSNK